MAIMNAAQTLILDLVPDQGSSVTACVCRFLVYVLLLRVVAEQPRAGCTERDHGCGHRVNPDGSWAWVDIRAARRDVRRGLALDICGDAYRTGVPGEAKAQGREEGCTRFIKYVETYGQMQQY